MVENAAVRAQRMLDLVPFLHSHPGITVAEVAAEFGVTKAEVIKDLNLLFVCGLPGYSHLELLDISFEDDIIHMMDAQNIGKPRALTEEESLSLRIALQALVEVLPAGHRAQSEIPTLISKISKRYSHVLPPTATAFTARGVEQTLKVIENALKSSQRLKIEYFNRAKDEKSTRVVSPQRLIIEGERVNLEAWCHTSDALRTFSVSQIVTLEILPEAAFSHGDEEKHRRNIASIRFFDSQGDFNSKYASQIIETKLGASTFVFYNPEWLTRIGMVYCDQIELLEPVQTRRALAERAKKALEHYR